MTPDEDAGLLAAARAIDVGEPVDWDALESSRAASESFAVILRELRVVADIAQLHRTLPGPVTSSLTSDVVTSPGVGPAPAAPLATPPAAATWGPLRLLELVGHGAFGDVYRAWDPRLDREVALKLLRRTGAQSDSVGSQIIHEGRMLARVRHPNVVTVHGADRLDGCVGLWMEFVKGRTLEAVLSDHGPFGAQEATMIGLDLCRALSAVHGAGLIHRDVKAQNVMREAGGRLVLMDFGTGREVFDAAEPELAGTPLYLAPEVFENMPASARSDIYSVGVLLFHLVTASYPILGRSVADIREAHRQRRRTWLRDARPDLPPAFVQVVERALDPDSDMRFESVGVLEAALGRVVVPADSATSAAVPSAVTAIPAGLPASVATPQRTSRPLWMAGAVLALAAVVLAIVFTPGTWRARILGGSEPGSVRNVQAGMAPGNAVVVRKLAMPAYLTLGGPSPDGRFFSLTDESGNLAVLELGTGDVRRVTADAVLDRNSQYAERSVISADGQWVAYTWFALDGRYELRVADLEGKRPRVLLRADDISYVWPLEWSRDGGSILAVLTRPDRVNHLVLISAADGSVHTVKELGTATPERASLSPDGAFVVYDHPQQPSAMARDIFIAAADGSSDRRLVGFPSTDIAPVWTPDGARVLFASDRSGAMDLWSVRVDAGTTQGEPEIVHRNIGRTVALGLDDAGSYFYYQTVGAVEVYEAELAPDAVRGPSAIPATYSGSNISSTWSPEGRRIAYASRRGLVNFDRGFTTLAVRDLETGQQRELVPAMKSFLVRAWAPDGRHVLVQGADVQGRTGAFAVDLDTGQVNPIVVNVRPDQNNIRRPDWLGDGRMSYIDSARQALLARDVHTGTEQLVLDLRKAGIDVVANVFGRGYRLSPDGHSLAYTATVREGERAAQSVWVRGLDGRPARELVRAKAPEAVLFQDWIPDGTALLYTRWTAQAEQPVSLWRVPVEGGDPQALGLTQVGLRDVSVHADGSRITFTAGWPKGEVWVMERLVGGRSH
jgi:Tol biopolymer transport system component/tRNA A-37 threonylcarbamoyl transferase component Bud32